MWCTKVVYKNINVSAVYLCFCTYICILEQFSTYRTIIMTKPTNDESTFDYTQQWVCSCLDKNAVLNFAGYMRYFALQVCCFVKMNPVLAPWNVY